MAGSCGVVISHDNPLPKGFERRLNLLRSRVVVRVEHAAHHGLTDVDAAGQFRLADAKLANRPVES
jgi:hypothetical protein